MARVGIVGGSGLYRMEGLEGIREEQLETPFGRPSDAYMVGSLDGVEVAFLPRHGRGHRLLPSELNYRANVYGFKSLGVEFIIAVSAVGSLRPEIEPLDIVMVDQFVDRTNRNRRMTFFGEGIAAHIGFADPVCPVLHDLLLRCAEDSGAKAHPRGTYLNMEGPAFSTRAESKLYRSWGMDVIGMTNLAEAKLAREAEICYATMACVADYDCWHESEDAVTVEMLIDNLQKNAVMAQQAIRRAVSAIAPERTCACADALKYAILTPPDRIPPEARKALDVIIGRHVE